MPRTRPPYSPEFRRQMVDLVRAGRNPDDLAREFEPSGHSIRAWVAQAARWRRHDGRGRGGHARSHRRRPPTEREVLGIAQLAICRVRGLQIVNGAQTTASLHRAGRRDGVDLSLVSVPAKITIVSRDLVDRMVPLISLYANTQNVVEMADFSANESFHVEFERRANTIWCPGERGRWFYERARGQY